MSYADLTIRLGKYLEAETAVLKSQEYTIGQGQSARRLRRADLAEIRAAIKNLQDQIDNCVDNPNRVKRRGVFYLRPY